MHTSFENVSLIRNGRKKSVSVTSESIESSEFDVWYVKKNWIYGFRRSDSFAWGSIHKIFITSYILPKQSIEISQQLDELWFIFWSIIMGYFVLFRVKVADELGDVTIQQEGRTSVIPGG